MSLVDCFYAYLSGVVSNTGMPLLLNKLVLKLCHALSCSFSLSYFSVIRFMPSRTTNGSYTTFFSL